MFFMQVRHISWIQGAKILQTLFTAYAFFWGALVLCRALFLLLLSDYMGASTSFADIILASWRGLRLSMQTAGGLTLFWFFFYALHTRAEKIARAVCLFLLTFLFIASFPYYRQFHALYGAVVFHVPQEGLLTMFWTLIEGYGLLWRLPLTLGLTWVLWKGFGIWLQRLTAKPWFERRSLRLRVSLGIVFTAWLALLSFYGGSLSWRTSVDWENAGVTKDSFLNEAILDDFQAAWRAYRTHRRQEASNGLSFTRADVAHLAALRSGKPEGAASLLTYITREARGTQKPPSDVIVIISESYAAWPLLDEYANLHLADDMKALLAEDDTDVCLAFLPAGASTVSAMTSIVTGLADANLYLTTMERSFAAPYPTASAPQFAKLGYDTTYWYAGPASWERVEALTKAQGFQHFYSQGDYQTSGITGSVWGVDDEFLYAAFLRLAPKEGHAFHVIMNGSNHAPFTVDLAAKGFPREEVRKALPPKEQHDEELLTELGHYWYASRELAKFVQELKVRYPQALIAIVGDHADRYNLEKTPSLYHRYAIPFILTGYGVHKGMLPKDAAGSQIDIVPTLMDLIAPPKTQYVSIGRSLLQDAKLGVNFGFWVSAGWLGEIPYNETDAQKAARNADHFGTGAEPSMAAVSLESDAVHAISWMIPTLGTDLQSGEAHEGK